MHVRLADESICIGSHQPQNSYLNIAALMSAADVTGAEAIHPGYGFLSENAQFAEIVNKKGIKFIGPSSDLIKKMGDKIEARKIAKENGLPIIEGSVGNVNSIEEAKKISEKIGYPVLIKAASSLAKGSNFFKSSGSLTIFIPFPPPPAAAFIRTG
jgi:acetyl-CoA carboxylase biotin carboxylase subunit